MTDIEMFRIMGLENSEDWMNPVHHTEQVIKQARAFFDSWLTRFPAWGDFVQGCVETPLAEFGPSRENAIQQVSDWLGGAAEAPHSYAYIVKYGVGATILHRFTGVRESTILAALTAFPPFPPVPLGGPSAAEIVQRLHILTKKLYAEPLKILVQAGLAKTERPEVRIFPGNL